MSDDPKGESVEREGPDGVTGHAGGVDDGQGPGGRMPDPERLPPLVRPAADFIAKIRALGWKPKLAIREGILRTLEYLKAHPWVLEKRS